MKARLRSSGWLLLQDASGSAEGAGKLRADGRFVPSMLFILLGLHQFGLIYRFGKGLAITMHNLKAKNYILVMR